MPIQQVCFSHSLSISALNQLIARFCALDIIAHPDYRTRFPYGRINSRMGNCMMQDGLTTRPFLIYFSHEKKRELQACHAWRLSLQGTWLPTTLHPLLSSRYEYHLILTCKPLLPASIAACLISCFTEFCFFAIDV